MPADFLICYFHYKIFFPLFIKLCNGNPICNLAVFIRQTEIVPIVQLAILGFKLDESESKNQVFMLRLTVEISNKKAKIHERWSFHTLEIATGLA